MKSNFSLDILFKTIIPAIILTSAIVISILPVSCKATEEGIKLLSNDIAFPNIQEFLVKGNDKVEITFDKPVKSVQTIITETDEPLKKIESTVDISEEKKSATFSLLEKTVVGKNYKMQGNVVDENGNSLTFSIPFTGFNELIPCLIFSEVRNAYSTSTKKSTGVKKYKPEYIELYSLTGGNLSGLELVSAGDGEEKKYRFPSSEINKGEYITFHLRNLEEGSNDETGTDLSISTATDSCNTARDFWVNNNSSRISQSDILILRNSADGSILDAFVFALSTLEKWNSDYDLFVKTVESSGIWLDTTGNFSCNIKSAVQSDNITSSAATRSFSRQNISSIAKNFKSDPLEKITDSASQWIVTASGGATPGYENSTTSYVKK